MQNMNVVFFFFCAKFKINKLMSECRENITIYPLKATVLSSGFQGWSKLSERLGFFPLPLHQSESNLTLKCADRPKWKNLDRPTGIIL